MRALVAVVVAVVAVTAHAQPRSPDVAAANVDARDAAAANAGAPGLADPNADEPRIELYTMGVGDDVFSAFGHAAICVFDGAAPGGRCYNYGTADFTTPVPLTWAFIRGRALFWVSVTDVASMLRYYIGVGRAVWRQRLPLPREAARRAAALLAASAEERAKFYRYHHFDDNCTTRIRDILDRATDGSLGRARADSGKTFRQWAREGFAGEWPLLFAVELLLGRSADRRTDEWTAMFLPSQLRARVAERLDAPPELLLQGRLRPPPGRPWLGLAAFAIAGALLAALVLAAARVGPRAYTAALAATAIVLGLIALVLDLLALLSTFPELTRNELLLAYWPTDLLLPWLPRRRQYLTLRLIVLGALAILHLGLLVQPLPTLLLPLLPLGAARLIERRRPPA
jgi:hypothetical protein